MTIGSICRSRELVSNVIELGSGTSIPRREHRPLQGRHSTQEHRQRTVTIGSICLSRDFVRNINELGSATSIPRREHRPLQDRHPTQEHRRNRTVTIGGICLSRDLVIDHFLSSAVPPC